MVEITVLQVSGMVVWSPHPLPSVVMIRAATPPYAAVPVLRQWLDNLRNDSYWRGRLGGLYDVSKQTQYLNNYSLIHFLR